jgi:hypothetical protein
MRIEWSHRVDGDGNTLWPFNELEPLRPAESWEESFQARFLHLVEGFALFNPHATFLLDWFGIKTVWEATNPTWPKWKPCQPTSAHWYELAHIERLIGAYITHARESGEDRLVSDFIAEFDGLSGSGKRTRVLDQAGLRRTNLSELALDGRLNSDRIKQLLAAMQEHSRPVRSERLGIIGEDHMRERLLAMGAKPESFRYRRKVAKSKKSDSAPDEIPSFMPGVLELAFGWLGDQASDNRRIYAGVNWSAAINNPFRCFGSTGEGLETVLSELKATRFEPIVFAIHLANPRVEYTDRGKSALLIAAG